MCWEDGIRGAVVYLSHNGSKYSNSSSLVLFVPNPTPNGDLILLPKLPMLSPGINLRGRRSGSNAICSRGSCAHERIPFGRCCCTLTAPSPRTKSLNRGALRSWAQQPRFRSFLLTDTTSISADCTGSTSAQCAWPLRESYANNAWKWHDNQVSPSSIRSPVSMHLP